MSELNCLPAHQLAAIKGRKMETCRHCSEQRNQTGAVRIRPHREIDHNHCWPIRARPICDTITM